MSVPYEFKVLTPEEATALRSLQAKIGTANRLKGFHEEGTRLRALPQLLSGAHGAVGGILPSIVDKVTRLFPGLERNYWAARLALITTEVAEAIEELRKGRRVDETWYSGGALIPGLGLLETDAIDYHDQPRKPEGVPSEVADATIRSFDLADEAKFDLAEIIDRKLHYNATRPFMHGKKA